MAAACAASAGRRGGGECGPVHWLPGWKGGGGQATLWSRIVPKQYYGIVQLEIFVRQWKQLGLGDDDLRALETQLLEDPRSAPVIPGAGGVRKMRFAPPAWGRGKSGATRVLYLFLEVRGLIFLFAVYAKSEQETASAEQLKEIRAMAEAIKKSLE
jgi:hypothetical protein